MNWRVNLAVLWFGNFLVMGSATMITPFLVLYIQELGITDPEEAGLWSGIIFAAHFITLFFFQPLWGKVADRYGRKMMMLRAGFGMALVISMMGLVTAPWQLLALRLLNGAVAGYTPAANAVLATSTPKERLGFAMGMLQSGSIAGTVTGPLIGGLLAEWVGLKQVFLITGAVTFFAALMAALWVKEAPRAEDASARAHQHISVMQGLRVLCGVRGVPTLFVVSMGAQFALTGALPFIPLFVQQLTSDAGMLTLQVGLVSSLAGLTNFICSPLLGKWGDRIGALRILLLAVTGTSVIVALHALVTDYWQLLTLRALLGVCLGGLIPTVRTLLKERTPGGMETRAYSFDASAVSLGSVAGPIISGFLLGVAGIQGIFMLSACVLLLNVFLVWRMQLSVSAQASVTVKRR